MQSEICNFFSGKCIFITGATGFMGKVLVEKLLRSCPNIKKLYLLLRSKDDANPHERLFRFKHNKIFRTLPEEVWSRVEAIEGDVSQQKLGLNLASRTEIINTVSIIFHVAASVRFDESLKSAVLLNTRGTREVLALALQVKNLISMVHVSTAYSNPLEKHLKEDVYIPVADPHKVINMAEVLSADEMDILTNRLLGELPNTYIFTKSLAESIVHEASSNIPVTIFRPSIVCPALKEPYPGWADSKLGPMGMLVGAGTGLIRCVYGDGDIVSDILPVDYGVNAMIAAAWATAKHGSQVINCTTSSEVPVTMNQVLALGRHSYAKYPYEKAFWYPGGAMYKTSFKYVIVFILTQLLPAILLDSVLFLFRGKPWLLQLQRRIYNNMKTVQYFLLNQWSFNNDNLRRVFNDMNALDRQIFNFDAKLINYKEYMDIWVIGVRRHLMGQRDETIRSSQINLNRLYYLHKALEISLYWLLSWNVSTWVINSVLCYDWTVLIAMLP